MSEASDSGDRGSPVYQTAFDVKKFIFAGRNVLNILYKGLAMTALVVLRHGPSSLSPEKLSF